MVLFLSPSFCFSLDLSEEIKERKIPAYIIDNTSYISVKSLLRILGCEDAWGRVEDRVFIVHEGGEIKFRLGGKQVIFEGRTEYLNSPVREVEGEVLIPVDDFGKILAGLKTEAPAVKEEPWQKKPGETAVLKKEKFVILIDPGHGGSDRGAVGNYGLEEKAVNLDIAKRMGEYLKKELAKKSNIKIYLTRDDDINVSLEERVQMAKDINADIFFSIHTNSTRYRNPEANGFETYYSGEKENLMFLPPPSDIEGLEDDYEKESALYKILEDLSATTAVDESRILADFVQERLAERLLTPDRGTKRRGFYVLKYTPMPAVLTEVGFLCNPNVEWNLRDIEVRKAIAETLGKAVLDYLAFRNFI